jgi:hypothetical protein
MDPSNPRPAAPAGAMSMSQVQKWVLSALAFVTILHMSAGLVIAAMFIDDDRLDARIGLNILAMGFGVLAVAAARGIHQWRMLSPWLLLGVVPGIVGLLLTLR